MHAHLHEGVLDVRIPFASHAHSAFSMETMPIGSHFRLAEQRAEGCPIRT
jgi:hypothetical protein